MRSTAVALGSQENMHAHVPLTAESFLVRMLRALVASHEFSLLMPDYDGVLTGPCRQDDPDRLRETPRSHTCGNSASPEMSSQSER